MNNTGQSKAGSFTEALANIAVGVVIAFLSQEVIFKLYGIPCPTSLNIKMTFWFTLISLTRSFILRRVFNYFTIRKNREQEVTTWVNATRTGRAGSSPWN